MVGADILAPRTFSATVVMQLGLSSSGASSERTKLGECLVTSSRPTCSISVLDDTNQPLLQGSSTGRLGFSLQLGSGETAEQEHTLSMSSFSSSATLSIARTYYSFQSKFDYERVTSGDRVRAVEAVCEVGAPQPIRLSRPAGWARLIATTPAVNCNVIVHASIGGMTMPVERRMNGITHGDIVFASVSAGEVFMEVRSDGETSDGGSVDAGVDMGSITPVDAGAGG